MPPCTEKEQLSLYEVLLFLSSICHLIKVLQTEVGLTDTVPGMLQRMSIFVGRFRIRVVSMQETLVVIIPVTIVAQVKVSSNMSITQTCIHNLILAPVERSTPHIRLLIRDTVIDFLYKSLESGEVLEGSLRINIRIWRLIKIVIT